jgi:hypothetical protein
MAYSDSDSAYISASGLSTGSSAGCSALSSAMVPKCRRRIAYVESRVSTESEEEL